MFSRLWQGNNHRTFEIYRKKLRYIFLLHQTTTLVREHRFQLGCVISFFYIKPQPGNTSEVSTQVALYLSSTSNHNCICLLRYWLLVALYLSSTSNHNWRLIHSPISRLRYIFLLHQTTTVWFACLHDKRLRYIFLLHQTTTYMR